MGIPQVALVCGSSTAGGAYVPAMVSLRSHWRTDPSHPGVVAWCFSWRHVMAAGG